MREEKKLEGISQEKGKYVMLNYTRLRDDCQRPHHSVMIIIIITVILIFYIRYYAISYAREKRASCIYRIKHRLVSISSKIVDGDNNNDKVDYY